MLFLGWICLKIRYQNIHENPAQSHHMNHNFPEKNMALWWYTTCAHPSIIKLIIHPMLSPLWLVGIVMKIFLVSKSPARGLSHLYHVYIFIHGLKAITPLIAEYDHSNKKHITKQRDLHGRPVSLPPEPWHMFTTTQQREIRNASADQHGHPISQN